MDRFFGRDVSGRVLGVALLLIALVLGVQFRGMAASRAGRVARADARRLAVVAARGSSAASPSRDVTGTANGAVVAPELSGEDITIRYDGANAPVLPSHASPERYVKDYYAKAIAGDREAAFRMVKAGPKETVQGFAPLSDGRYGVSGFSVVATVATGADVKMFVAQTAPGNGVWTVIWDFTRTARGTVLTALTFTRASEFPCH